MSSTITNEDIDDLLPEEQISLSEPPAEKDACIEHLLDLVVESGRVSDRERALDALLEREEQTTTGVGMGIGIPHAQTDAVKRPSLAFARSSSGVDFGSMDDEPAKLLFLILVPASGGEDHLEILSALSRALMHEEVRDGLYAAETPADVQSVLQEAVA
ncbi:PTS sugar transporter subunit IIA [Halalkalicoccus jeotgali]|uniref:Sugar hosphotransferase system IIA component n=1 Tax=Halalkalicoccus jeotgali (strain DSM 18796 / CECT 7217 / JCM 14584 / KCTC 4019 / B3) TaxID=795797 RepID=D8J425_HALJB|nr:fructose PTS transporter subunit IIA [Halalkalicoccus jeotgali]ADJ15417.1 sugar hosphotransferase system IIA component [Halalkalicoccus jeotgali B3]ELY35807.1 sugar hosphotransferase system IIA component [Halalkalicoccus jeotgali B3]